MKSTPVTITAQGSRADIGSYKINRLLPNRYMDAIGPFVFLDHLMPTTHEKLDEDDKGTGPHPHRGIATLTYVFNGLAEHYDSRGHHAIVSSGGVQWMKAGNGIVHDESMRPDAAAGSLTTHSMQFWINLPETNKAEEPAYLPLQSNEVPQKSFEGGSMRLITGKYEDLQSPIPSYSKEFVLHINLEGGAHLSLPASAELEYALFLPLQPAMINEETYQQGDLLSFDRKDGSIDISNPSKAAIDLIFFGGEPYTEPIFASGPFVMNSQAGITQAYNDYYGGSYGSISYVPKS